MQQRVQRSHEQVRVVHSYGVNAGGGGVGPALASAMTAVIICINGPCAPAGTGGGAGGGGACQLRSPAAP
eukprot:123022-Prymnesium_polylepis.1